jgi:hypothetical protein
MSSKRKQKVLGREKLQRIVEMCASVEDHSVDPFLIEVDELLEVIKVYFPKWELPEDLCLDAETLNHLASIVKLQSEWVEQRSTSLYTDPFLLEEKLADVSNEDIVRIFLKAWHPIVGLERITLHSLENAMNYWRSLIPIKERWKESVPEKFDTGLAEREELIRQRVLGDKPFSQELDNYWRKLQKKVADKGLDGRIRYWDFIGGETFAETVQNAFITSFLVTYGYATLEIYPLEEDMFIRPFDTRSPEIGKKQLISIPIAVKIEDWLKWRKGDLE